MADWNGFKKNGTTYIPNDATARASISAIEGKIPSAASSSNKLVDTSTMTTELNGKVNVSSVGASNGVAGLDANGRVPSSQLPSYVDDVLEYASLSDFPATGETGKIYIALDTNKTYRWSGSAYVEISESLALGETSSTAYAGDKGKANADNITALQTGKADKVSSATNGNFAGLNASGNLTDSGVKPSDFAPSSILNGSSIDSFSDVETALATKQNTLTFDNTPTANSNNPVKSGGVKSAVDAVDAKANDLYSNIGILSTPVPSYVANTLPVLKRNITSAFYNGSLRGEIAAGNFKNVRAGDYIIGQATGSTYYVAMCDYRLGKGDQTNNTNYPAYGTHHLGLMLFKPVGTTALWKGYGNQDKSWRVSAADLGRCPWNAATDADPTDTEAIGSNNTNITRTYNGANVSGYMGSFIRERIDAILLPQCFQADFGSANVLKYREIHGNGVDTTKASGAHPAWTGLTSGWTWYDRYIDLPSEVELYGSRVWSSSGFDVGCQCEQLPLFRNAAIHDFFPRIDVWTKAVASSSSACVRNYNGFAYNGTASVGFWACPLAAVK